MLIVNQFLGIEGEHTISVSIFHGGRLKRLPQVTYVGGQVTVYYLQDVDISYDSLRTYAKAMGYKGLFCLYYRRPNVEFEKSLQLITDDSYVVAMKGYAMENDNKIDIYVEHCDETNLGAFDDINVFERSEGDGSNEVGEWSDELDDYDFDDSDYSDTDDDMVYANNVDEGVEWVGRIRDRIGLGKEDTDSDKAYNDTDCDDDSDSLPDNDMDEDEELQALKRKNRFPVYKDSDNPQWNVGMIFTDHYQCREAIIKHSYKEGRVVKFVKSDKTRVRAVCKPPCPWFLNAGYNFDRCIQIKKVGPGTFWSFPLIFTEFPILVGGI